MNKCYYYGILLWGAIINVQADFACLGRLSITPKIGIAPTLFTDREENYLVVPTALTVDPIVSIGLMPKYSQFFKVPVYVGGSLNWEAYESLIGYFELTYRHGKGKTVQIPANLTPIHEQFLYTIEMQVFRALGFYGGITQKIISFCGCFDLGIGAKIGLMHHWQINGHITASDYDQCVPLFYKNTVLSGGLLVNVEKLFCDCFSLAITGEVVASGGLKNNRNYHDEQQIQITNANFGAIGTEILFPVYIGFTYLF